MLFKDILADNDFGIIIVASLLQIDSWSKVNIYHGIVDPTKNDFTASPNPYVYVFIVDHALTHISEFT